MTRLMLGTILLLLSVTSVVASEPVKIFTSVFPPIVNEGKENPGYAYEIVEEIFKVAGIDYKISQVPWARAQAIVENTPGSLIFPLTRTPTRETKFHWGFKMFNTQTHFVTLNNNKLTRETAKTKLVSVQLASSWDNWLTENGYTNVVRLSNEGEQHIRMLSAGRTDAWYAEKSVAKDMLKNMDIENATFSDPVLSFDTYLASNKAEPFKEMDKLKAAFDEIVESGRYAEILRKYHLL